MCYLPAVKATKWSKYNELFSVQDLFRRSNHYIDHIFLLLKPLQGILSSCSCSYFRAPDFLPLDPAVATTACVTGKPVATTGKPWGHPPAHRLDTAGAAHSSLNCIHCTLLAAHSSLHTHLLTLITAHLSLQSLHCTLITAYY